MRRGGVAIALGAGLGGLALTTIASAEVFVYPKPGAGQESRRQDQYECHTWARTQTGFDPSQVVVAPAPAEEARTRVRREYVPRFRTVLPDPQVVRFLQVERRLDAVVNAELATRVPLVK